MKVALSLPIRCNCFGGHDCRFSAGQAFRGASTRAGIVPSSPVVPRAGSAETHNRFVPLLTTVVGQVRYTIWSKSSIVLEF